jgi:nucleoside-diphosphate-sugar epimerase
VTNEPDPDAHVVVVTGAASPLGQQVCALAAADPHVAHVVALDKRPMHRVPAHVEAHRVDLATADLKPLLEGARSVVHLAQASGPEPSGHPSTIGEGTLARRVLDAASAVGATHLVLLSSATVYGAWANNPVPLTEDAPLRPNPGVTVASEKADLERSAAEWRDAHPRATVAILRPTITVSSGGNGWLAKALARPPAIPITDDEPPAQFLDVGDLATAVDLARRAHLDGPRNVASDGWVSAETVRALAGSGPRVRLPEWIAVRLAGMRWRWGLAPTPPALLPFTVHPWVVANDRLRADGWEPASTNEEAFVSAHTARLWDRINPHRRQELTLGVAVLGLVAVASVVVARLRRRPRG